MFREYCYIPSPKSVKTFPSDKCIIPYHHFIVPWTIPESIANAAGGSKGLGNGDRTNPAKETNVNDVSPIIGSTFTTHVYTTRVVFSGETVRSVTFICIIHRTQYDLTDYVYPQHGSNPSFIDRTRSVVW